MMDSDIDQLLCDALVAYYQVMQSEKPDKEAEKRRLIEEIQPALPLPVRKYLHLTPRYDGGWLFFLYIPGCFPIQIQFQRRIGGMEIRSAVVLDENAKSIWFSRQLLQAIGKARQMALKTDIPERLLKASAYLRGEIVMKGFCPMCEKETELLHIQRMENIEIKGVEISVEADLFQCLECKEEFDNPDPNYDPLQVAYQKYNSLTNSDIGNHLSK